MSACLLCLSVLSLVLPTAFHASFQDASDGNRLVLRVSRGTSVVLLLVYLLYLVFTLKSHSFMYASTPQHLIDEESQHPGILAEILNSSSSSDSSSSSSSDSDSSRKSNTTAKKIKRALRRRRRKSVSSSKDDASAPSFARTLSDDTNTTIPSPNETMHRPVVLPEPILSGDEADMDGEGRIGRRRSPRHHVRTRDFESGSVELDNLQEAPGKHSKRHKHIKRHSKKSEHRTLNEVEKGPDTISTVVEAPVNQDNRPSPPKITFLDPEGTTNSSPRPFNMRQISEAVHHAGLNSSLFPHHAATGRPLAMPLQNLRPPSQPRSPNSESLRRTSSMPDQLLHVDFHLQVLQPFQENLHPRRPLKIFGTRSITSRKHQPSSPCCARQA
jgi:Ca2+:H+ antiporter